MTTVHTLIQLFKRRDVNRFPGLEKVIDHLQREGLCGLFETQRLTAPHRHPHKRYFVAHTGKTTSGSASNRREEHLAICLWHTFRKDGFALPDGTRLFPLDYQVPLKSHRNEENKGVGKIDLFCAEASGQPWIIELKVHPKPPKQSVETPLKAFLEGLAYCAIVDANLNDLRSESLDKQEALGRSIAALRPNLLIVAPTEYWTKSEFYDAKFPWIQPLIQFRIHLADALGIQTRLVELQDCVWNSPGLEKGPCFSSIPSFAWARADS